MKASAVFRPPIPESQSGSATGHETTRLRPPEPWDRHYCYYPQETGRPQPKRWHEGNGSISYAQQSGCFSTIATAIVMPTHSGRLAQPVTEEDFSSTSESHAEI